jgi:hypothetical protein
MSLTSGTTVPARLGSTPDDYARIGVEPARSSRGRTGDRRADEVHVAAPRGRVRRFVASLRGCSEVPS